jgi:nitroreductase
MLKKIISLLHEIIRFIGNVIYDSYYYALNSTINVFNKRDNLGARIIAHTHSIERAFSLNNTRFPFGVALVKSLKALLNLAEIESNLKYEIMIAERCLLDYNNFHSNNGLRGSAKLSVKPFQFVDLNKKSAYIDVVNTRRSIRNFGDEKISSYSLLKAISIAKNSSPSVCNRQAWNVLIINDNIIIDKCLKLQNGNSGIEGIQTLLVITTTLNSFFGSSERNQAYIDGGIFLMSLLNSMHFLNLASCCLNWSVDKQIDIDFKSICSLSSNSVIISLVAVGSYRKDAFLVARSMRKPLRRIVSFRS